MTGLGITDLGVDDLARAARITRKHARRVVSDIRDGKRTTWRGAEPELISTDPDQLAFQSLPVDVRETIIVQRDQLPLPLVVPRDTPPAREQYKFN